MANWWDQMGTTIGDNLIGMQMPFGMEPPTDPQQRAQMINPMLMQIGASMLAGRKQNPAVNVGNALMGAQAMGQQNMGRQLYASQLAQAAEDRKERKETENRTRSWAKSQPWAKDYPVDTMDTSDIFKIAVGANKPPDMPASVDEFNFAKQNGFQGNYVDFMQLGKGAAPNMQVVEVDGMKYNWNPQTGQLGEALGKSSNRDQPAPSGYRFAADGKTLEAIPGGPATKMPAEVAGRVAMLDTAMKDMPSAIKFFVGEDGKGSGNSVGSEGFGWAFNSGEYGRAARTIRMAIEAGLRAMTGAAAPESEVKNYENMFLPSPVDTVETRNQKLTALQDFMEQAKAIMEQGRGLTPEISGGGGSGGFKIISVE
jgi:hypothetical protein